MVASDRLSAFDVVLPTPIPGKGRLLTQMSVRWFEFLRQERLIGDHLISTDPAGIPGLTEGQRRQLDGRVMIGRGADVIPIECVARGWLAGSGWTEYEATQRICGVALPPGLRRGDQLPEPIFTPATKAAVGHDENIDFARACEIAGRQVMELLRDVTLRIYRRAAAHAQERGIILADTKFEFGRALDDRGQPTDEIILIDEVLTPDSSRYWPVDSHQPGREGESFDKQFVRNYLLELVAQGKWNKTPPGPELPAHVVEGTLRRYEEAYERLWGG